MQDIVNPHGPLLGDAAKQQFPLLYEKWVEASKQWRALGMPGSGPYTTVRGRLTSPEKHHPSLVAVYQAQHALTSACQQEFSKPNWIVTGLMGSIGRTHIDGDFLRGADINLSEQRVWGSSGRQTVVADGVRVRPMLQALEVSAPPVWMNLQLPWFTKISALCEAAWRRELPAETPGAPAALLRGNLGPHGAKAECLKWICSVTETPLDKNGKPPSSIEKAFREYLKAKAE